LEKIDPRPIFSLHELCEIVGVSKPAPRRGGANEGSKALTPLRSPGTREWQTSSCDLLWKSNAVRTLETQLDASASKPLEGALFSQKYEVLGRVAAACRTLKAEVQVDALAVDICWQHAVWQWQNGGRGRR
jgi:hypothetical protein